MRDSVVTCSSHAIWLFSKHILTRSHRRDKVQLRKGVEPTSPQRPLAVPLIYVPNTAAINCRHVPSLSALLCAFERILRGFGVFGALCVASAGGFCFFNL